MKNEFNLRFENQNFDHLNLKPYMNVGPSLENIMFLNCTFYESTIDSIINCVFKSCKLDTLYMRKGAILSSEFEDCQLIDIGLFKGDIINSHFTNCTFINFRLGIGYVGDCTFKDCQFQMDNLDMFEPITPKNIKLWHEGEWRTVTDWQEFLRLQTPN